MRALIKAWRRWTAGGPRWMVASLLNRSPRTCWAELVPWAMHDRDQGDSVVPFNGGRDCRAESLCHRDRSCYCGKFQDGQMGKEADR